MCVCVCVCVCVGLPQDWQCHPPSWPLDIQSAQTGDTSYEPLENTLEKGREGEKGKEGGGES